MVVVVVILNMKTRPLSLIPVSAFHANWYKKYQFYWNFNFPGAAFQSPAWNNSF